MTGVTDKSPPHAHTHARSKYTHTHARKNSETTVTPVTPVTKRLGVNKQSGAIHREYGIPIRDVVAGYLADGQSLRSVARIVGIPRTTIRRFAIDAGLSPPAHPVTLQTKSRLHRAHIRATMRKARGRRITWAGKTLTVSEWSNHTGIPRITIHTRLSRGWPTARALTERIHR